MSPRQVYLCKQDGEFEISLLIKDYVPEQAPCPVCDKPSTWVPSVPNFIGGPTTGAGKE